MAATCEESSSDYSDGLSSDNFSIYTESSSSEEDLLYKEPSTFDADVIGNSFFRGKALSKNKPTCKNAVA